MATSFTTIPASVIKNAVDVQSPWDVDLPDVAAKPSTIGVIEEVPTFSAIDGSMYVNTLDNDVYYHSNSTWFSTRKQSIVVESTDYTLLPSDQIVIFTATATANLPIATGSGQTYRIICRAGTTTIDGNVSETIKGETTQVLTAGEDLIITDTASGIWE
jgi:hypothetical protein